MAAVESRPRLKRVNTSVPFEELRYRSYPSFTRIVVEAGAELSYLVAAGQKEIRVRLSSLAVPALRVEEIDDGLVKEVRLESTGPDALLKIVLEGRAADVKPSSPQPAAPGSARVHAPHLSPRPPVGVGRFPVMRAKCSTILFAPVTDVPILTPTSVGSSRDRSRSAFLTASWAEAKARWTTRSS